MKIYRCFVAVILSVILCVGTVVPAGATDTFNEWLSEGSLYILSCLNDAMPTGSVPKDTLEDIRDRYNYFLAGFQRGTIIPAPDFTPTPWDLLGPAVITEEGDSGIFRLIDSKNNFFITDRWGAYPYYEAAGDVPAEDIAVSNVHANKWCGLTERSKEVETVTHDALASAVIELNDAGIECSLVQGYYNEILYWFICTPDYKYYCNSKGEMFVAPAEASATDLNRPYVDDDGNPLDIEKVLDLENNILNLPGANGLSLELSIGNISYDAGDKSYTVNAYTTINEGDEYYYTYYTYNIQYNITNTYITYIGSNEPYERKEYELYYQLPDGRSSADLTAEEVAGMSFEFYDVVNYARSATDISVRGLYHFDGNTDDDSYFVGQSTGFEWNSGASITYMESPSAFGGNLYLDNNAHKFAISMPSIIGKNDFTIQFRYYQASELDTQTNIENSLTASAGLLSDGVMLKWDEQLLYDKDGNSLEALQIGTWNEFALVRHGGELFYYLNGHCLGHSKFHVVLGDELYFDFGSTSRAYSMLDELRILNFAITEGGADYQPTNVPYDSNLVLVLPDSDRPMADEYMEFTSSYENLFGNNYNFTLGDLTPTYFKRMARPGNYGWSTGLEAYPYFSTRNSGPYSFNRQSTSLIVSRNGSETDKYSGYEGSQYDGYYYTGFAVRMDGLPLTANTDYVFSIVQSDGTVNSLKFNTGTRNLTGGSGAVMGGAGNNGIYDTATFDWGKLQFRLITCGWSKSPGPYEPCLCIIPNDGCSLDIAYIALEQCSSTDLKGEWKTAVYDGETMAPNTAAIQTTIPVAGYTVGGVRPSMPAKGDLWFPVMENRITGVQIYAGTHWEEVNARWWTGSRWIPIYAFDINTLEDLFDIADGDDVVSLLPDTNSFFRWWQLQWLDFRAWLEDALANIGSGTGPGSGSDCQHVYSSEVSREPGCVEPGTTLYTCSNCGHQYTELIDAHGHDWITTDTVPDVLDENGTVIEKGYEILTCSVCDATAKDYGDGPEEDDLFDALGDLLAGGVEWLLDKLAQLADRLRLITDTFTEYIEKVKDFGGEYPAFFAAAFLLIPEELRILFWLAVVGVVVLAVWKKYSS